MKCPFCDYEDTKVVESRCTGHKVRRRRTCENCLKRFTTYEVVEHMPLMVIKRDNSREQFNRKKVFEGLFKACEKRPVSILEIEQIVQDIEAAVDTSLDREVPSSVIGDMCMQRLKEKDDVAYIRFASIYREFKDVESFMRELKIFLDERE